MIGRWLKPARRHAYDPLAVDGRRIMPATISEIERQYPNKLHGQNSCFVTQVLFESEKTPDGLYKVIRG